MDKKVLVDISGSVATITLNNAKRSNSMDEQLCSELAEAVYRVKQDSEIKAVVLTGAGKNFCAGGDLQSLSSLSDQNEIKMLHQIHLFILDMLEMEKPIIAAVNGAAAGLGFNLALAADILIAGEQSHFSQGFVKIGLAPDGGGAFLLPRLIGVHRAKMLFFTGDAIDAATAKEWGIVADVVPDQEVVSAAQALAERLAQGATRSIGLTKKLMNKGLEGDFRALLAYEAQVQGELIGTDDFKEGARAFLEKRKPVFSGK
ncbi:enoyl-CoA hydratase [Aneurinibacillus sp. Ricciae_BoGa-3]|uniref:enoyl-CoA hydratase/isomerase family protein n=1 Tax=Aneurinibacillus sp. Ricciae_BoGa-3 TaxID=3022697 RepID=UPI0023419E07|nr:enoyl-CoA hydratase [Aneurinibacillus sp. Ricciae_BoGa-3]WCK56563.1 enoyl-CoA hydratase [Aneurinibacillus sp. Ricciae_BoGa-3]